MQNIAPSFKNLEADQESTGFFNRGSKRRNGVVIPTSSPVFIELQKKINDEPGTQSSLGSNGSVSSQSTMEWFRYTLIFIFF